MHDAIDKALIAALGAEPPAEWPAWKVRAGYRWAPPPDHPVLEAGIRAVDVLSAREEAPPDGGEWVVTIRNPDASWTVRVDDRNVVVDKGAAWDGRSPTLTARSKRADQQTGTLVLSEKS